MEKGRVKALKIEKSNQDNIGTTFRVLDVTAFIFDV